MSRILVLITVAFSIGFSANAELLRLEGIPFQPATNIEIVWNVAVTNLPENVWVYKVIPQNFSTAVITNLLALSGLEYRDMARKVDFSVPDKDFARFETENKNRLILRCLDIAPNLGWIHYENNSGSGFDPLEPAPSEDEIIKLSFEDLFLAGIDRSQVLPTPKNYSISRSQMGNAPEIITARSVFLVRRIDGINERGFCFTANYGSRKGQPKLLSFDLNWRNLSPYKPCQVATTNEMSEFIRNGKATIPPQNIEFEKLRQAKKLTVTTFFPLYYNQLGSNLVKYEYPYVVMDIVADVGGGKTISFTMNCPLIDEGK